MRAVEFTLRSIYQGRAAHAKFFSRGIRRATDNRSASDGEPGSSQSPGRNVDVDEWSRIWINIFHRPGPLLLTGFRDDNLERARVGFLRGRGLVDRAVGEGTPVFDRPLSVS